eukprot:scaffold20987_cov31-Tisochrysis_lutea.AAC.5
MISRSFCSSSSAPSQPTKRMVQPLSADRRGEQTLSGAPVCDAFSADPGAPPSLRRWPPGGVLTAPTERIPSKGASWWVKSFWWVKSDSAASPEKVKACMCEQRDCARCESGEAKRPCLGDPSEGVSLRSAPPQSHVACCSKAFPSCCCSCSCLPGPASTPGPLTPPPVRPL